MKLTSNILQDLLEKLSEKFPNKIPKDIQTIDQLHILVGQQQVIRYLNEYIEKLERS